MLIEIKCDIFRQQTISFHKDLNVVLGDNQATNSIGKSTMLMIIDFIFAGETYLKHNKDVISEIRHHDFYFCLKFNNIFYKFKKSTNNEENIYECDEKYEVIKTITIDEYKTFLKDNYSLSYCDTSFRNIISTYLRIWGKGNYDIEKPLKTYKDDSKDSNGIVNLIKLFDKYSEIKQLYDDIKDKEESKKIVNGMYKKEYVPKITKTQYKKNTQRLEVIKDEIEDIKNNLYQNLLNIEKLKNKEILELKLEKSDLLKIKNRFDNKLQRIENNLKNTSSLKPKHLKNLKLFFPNANIDKIEEIEGFHNKISKILKSELQKSKKILLEKIEKVNYEIEKIDIKISHLLPNTDSSSIIINKVSDLTAEVKNIENNNEFFEKKASLLEDINKSKSNLNDTKQTIIKDIEEKINQLLDEINNKISLNTRKTPTIKLKENSYIFETPNDTGTGKAYINLIMFDLAILKLTPLPFLAHDSFLLKNIENLSINNLIRFYNSFNKQIFISIDEINKYDNDVIKILENKHVIKLDNDNLLFIKDWRIK